MWIVGPVFGPANFVVQMHLGASSLYPPIANSDYWCINMTIGYCQYTDADKTQIYANCAFCPLAFVVVHRLDAGSN